MRSVVVFDKFIGYQVGGAQMSLQALLDGVSVPKKYIGCRVTRSFAAPQFQNTLPVDRFSIREIPRLPYWEYVANRSRIASEIESMASDRDLLITQGLWAAPAVNAFSGKTILFIRAETEVNRFGNYHTGIARYLKYLYAGIQLPALYTLWRDNRRAVAKATVVVANSVYIAEQIKKVFGRESVVIYPCVPIKRLLQTPLPPQTDRPYLTLIGSEIMKGRAIVESLAAQMPHKKFLIVGREFRAPFERGNIRYEPWAKDVLAVYAKTSILLVPSLCAEAFGRVVIEARALGIPVLTSSNGGLPEAALSDCVISHVRDVQEWQEKITLIEESYDTFVVRGREGVDRFDERTQIDAFEHLLQSLDV